MRTILVVDDDQWVRMLARDVLAGEGYRVLEGSDGQDAIRVAAEHPGPIHLLLSDVMMPGMKVLFMSAYDRDFLVSHGMNPIGPVITKPFTTEYLSRRVRMVLDRQPEASPTG